MDKIILNTTLSCFLSDSYYTLEFALLIDESSDEEELESSTVSTKEWYDIDWAHTWEKAGGVLALAENKVQSLLTQYFSLFHNVNFYFYFSFAYLLFHVYVQGYRTHMRYLTPLFQGLHLLWQVTSLGEEASHLEVTGFKKMELVQAGSNVEALYGLLWDVISHTSSPVAMAPIKRYQWAATSTLTKPPPQEPKSTVPESSVSVAERGA